MMNNKKIYIAPELLLVEIADNDIITTSTGDSFVGEDDDLEIG
jgi:hypothetical protein